MLEQLKVRALFQNTIDVWIALCNERGSEWYSVDGYRAFIRYLLSKNVKMNRFPLCVKETGTYERSRDKVSLLDELSKLNTQDAQVYIVKLDEETLKIIREFPSLDTK
jgi:hypothetical protein